MKINFHFGRNRGGPKSWIAYSIGTAVAVSILTHYGNMLLSSKHGEFLRDAICSVSKVIPEHNLARLLSSLCRAVKDGKITTEEAKKVLDRASQASGVATGYFNNDSDNTSLRASDEVDFAIEAWNRANPGPKVDPALRKQFPNFTEEQLCVLSQAERYTDGESIGIRYVGMEVCDKE